MSAYPRLFSPITVGGCEIRNRILQTGHTKLYGRDGVDSDRDVAYQEARARGGIGLIITGNRMVHPTSTSATLRYSLGWLDEAVEADRRLTDAVHRHGAKIFAQLNHFGVNGMSDAADDIRVLWGPSGVASPEYGEVAKQMSHADIAEVREWWARCAELSREGGFDGVEVHLSHSYLLHQFISPVYNKRNDEYGGSLENRLRFAREVIEHVRARVGHDWVVGTRMSLSDAVDGGMTIDDAKEILGVLRTDGLLDYVNVTAGGYHDGLAEAIAPSDTAGGWLLDRIGELKPHVGELPLFAVGGLREPEDGERVLAGGIADMVAFTRAQIADPDFANKAREGRSREIYRCIRGNQGCIGRDSRGLPIGCTVNPSTGRERRLAPLAQQRSESPGSWAVVGGGPAGLKAAETLARRGHSVTVYERQDKLGGQVNLITQTPGRATFDSLVVDLARQLEILGVSVELGVDAGADFAPLQEVDAVIVATGARPDRTGYSSVAPLVDAIPGVGAANVFSVWDVVFDSSALGERVVVLDDDGSRYSAGPTELLLDRGHDVHLVTPHSSLYPKTTLTLDQGILYARAFEKGLRFTTNAWASRIEPGAVRIENLFNSSDRVSLDADSVVLATAPQAEDTLFHALEDRRDHVHRVGDAVAPRRLDHAVYEGFMAGLELWRPEERYMLEGVLEQSATR